MNSHEYAKKVKEAADYLLSRPEFETAGDAWLYLGSFWGDKEGFLGAVRGIGAGKKDYSGSDLKYTVTKGARMYFEVNRDSVCTLVTPAVYECEPLLSPEEEAEVGA